MKVTRRQFVEIASVGSAGLLLSRTPLWAFKQSPVGLRKFVAALPGLGPRGIPVAAANTTRYPGVDYYVIRAGQFRQVFHPDFVDSKSSAYIRNFSGSKLWGYASITDGAKPNHRYLGGLIIANRDRPVRIKVVNDLNDGAGNALRHPLPVDMTIPGAVPGQKENRIAIHLHGGHVPWMSDGGPLSWMGSDGTTGPSVVPWLPDWTGAKTSDLWYPNDQSARLMWYHDHAHDLTRLNAYAGLATGYLLLDPTELALINAGLIPPLDRTVPLILQEKSFIPLPRGSNDAGGRGDPGDLWYPSLYQKATEPDAEGRWDWGGDVFAGKASFDQPPTPSCVPEFYGDTTVINGMAFPFLTVQRRRYRFLLLNGTQARIYNLGLYFANPRDLTNIRMVTDPSTGHLIPDITRGGPPITQIGTEGGFLPDAVVFNAPPVPFWAQYDVEGNYIPGTMRHGLLLGGAERADVVIDFAKVPAGSTLILYNDAPAPFPSGDDRNDYYAQAPDLSSIGGAPAHTKPNIGPDTRTLLQFRVVATSASAGPETSAPPLRLPALDPPALAMFPLIPEWVSADSEAEANAEKPDWMTRIRDITLNEYFDQQGRLIQLLGTSQSTGEDPDGAPLFGRAYMDATTESPSVGDIEGWRFFNLTGDTHPIHFHLVNVQVVSRQPFDPASYDGTVSFLDDPVEPDPNELGWKETVRMNPGECTTVIMKFDRPPIPKVVKSGGKTFPVGKYPTSTRPGVEGTYEYVYHCHILEHEEHDMMRPLALKP